MVKHKKTRKSKYWRVTLYDFTDDQITYLKTSKDIQYVLWKIINEENKRPKATAYIIFKSIKRIPFIFRTFGHNIDWTGGYLSGEELNNFCKCDLKDRMFSVGKIPMRKEYVLTKPRPKKHREQPTSNFFLY